MRCEQYFYELYGKDAAGIAFAPYRVCPIGAQSDHNLGKITGFAIDKGIYIAYRPDQNGAVELKSLQYTKPVQWSVSDAGEKKGDWADYLRGATWAMNKVYKLSIGICGVIEGTLPVGGLSSSATSARIGSGCRTAPMELRIISMRIMKTELSITPLRLRRKQVGTLPQLRRQFTIPSIITR